jgi:SAM-dependent methyltransferase
VSTENHIHLSGQITSDSYLRERLNPHVGDMFYAHLKDLKTFLDSSNDRSAADILDYGCGGSPYKSLYNAKKYVRADYVESADLDISIGEDGGLPCDSSQFDIVLSTQVLEHVREPQIYLKEAFRVLRPGGSLILTTHGIWEDHGCPFDFRRWTADGLRAEIQLAGFDVSKMCKLTTGSRAVFFMFGRNIDGIVASRKTMLGWAFWFLRRSGFAENAIRNTWLDKYYGNCAVVPDDIPGHGTYIALGCVAIKPKSGIS